MKEAALVGCGVAGGDDGWGACGSIAGGGNFYGAARGEDSVAHAVGGGDEGAFVNDIDVAAACARRSSGGGFAGQKALRGFLDRRYGPVAHQEKRSCGCHFSIHLVESFCLQY